MFPIRDDNPQTLAPVATIVIVALNCAAWAMLQGLGTSPTLSQSVCAWGLIPGELLQTAAAGTRFQLDPGTTCVIGAHGQPLTLLTSMFMHGGWMHLIGNMWFLWIFGDNVEGAMGHLRFVVFYLLCGLAAAVTQVAVAPASTVPMVGASGAIGGVMGAYVLLYPRVHVHLLLFFGFYITTVAVPAILMLGYWFLLQLLGGFGSLAEAGGGVAFWAHVGGFAAGLVLVLLFRDEKLLAQHPYHGFRAQPMPTQSWHRVRGEPYYKMRRGR